MPTLGHNKYRESINTFIDDTRNYKRKSIDEQDDYSIVEDLLYLKNEGNEEFYNVKNGNFYPNLELKSSRNSGINIKLNRNNHFIENKNINEINNVNNYKNHNEKNDHSFESPLNELQRYQLTLLKRGNQHNPKLQKEIEENNKINNTINLQHSGKYKDKNIVNDIDISIKKNTANLNNTKGLKIQEKSITNKNDNNNHLRYKGMYETPISNNNFSHSWKNIENEKKMKCENFINSYEKIKGSFEIKKDNDSRHDNTLEYHDIIKKRNIKNERSDNEDVENDSMSKDIKKYNNNIKINERYKKINETGIEEMEIKKKDINGMDNNYGNYIIQVKNKKNNGDKHLDENYDENKKSILYDSLHKNTIKDISKNGYKMEYNYIMPTRDKYYKGMLDESDSKGQEPKNITYTNQNYRNNNKYDENHNRSTSNKINIDLSVSYKSDQNNIMSNSNKTKNKIKDEEHKEANTLNISAKKNSAHTQDEQEIKITNKNKANTHNISTSGYRNVSKPTSKSVNHNVQDNNYLSVKEKNSQSERKQTNISRSVTPNRSNKNGSISSKIKNDNTMTYLTYEDIQNFEFELSVDNINDMITKLLEITKDQEWKQQIENLINLRTILKYHDTLFFNNFMKDLRKICRSIVELLNSPRSCVSKNALLCLTEFYSIGKKKMDCTLDDVVMPCLKKAFQTSNDFLSTAANNSLLSICNSCSESKLIAYFVKIITLKQKTYNLICLKCLIAVIIKFEENISKYKELNKLIEALLECTSVGSAEIKCTARVALVVLDNICPIQPISSKLHICPEKIKKIINLIDRTSECEIDSVLGKIKFN
ncbi:conserved Plasmodium protein, unknown function [Plasmodium vinckei vinckei]|uniref:CLASP N-terminal domain-containing protein n=1 Tax=Plasmodium vinckei vinckei TaxID=54757 RepID=A0A449BXK1_PLAVN|nr:conserved Plasmodium protein, unknown function [Plasmodium vinckei vinckei]KEG04556.1 hypothetical protein YYE_00131 [Plasmodium vinckei vinckei]VEV58207.1 conserved Plasmodium protein, unknown function [Plasmodium vinckei vinckei]